MVFLTSFLGCAPQKSSPKTFSISNQSQIQQQQKPQAIIGGQKVLDLNDLHQKAIYLALGVSMVKNPSGRGLRISQTHQCTGFAINSLNLLTAAHCVENLLPYQIYAVTGLNPLKQKINLNSWFNIKKIVIHPRLDLAVLQLETELGESFISQVADEKILKEKNLNLITQQPLLDQIEFILDFTQVGYGLQTRETHFSTEELKNYRNELNEIKNKTLPFKTSDEFIHIDQESGSGICDGDSGGPGYIFDQKTNQHYVVGVLSGWASTDESQKCIGIARYVSIIQPKVQQWINSTLR